MCRRPEEEGCHMVGLPMQCPFNNDTDTGLLPVIPRLDTPMPLWDSNSQPKDDPYAVRIVNGQIHYANGVNTLSRLLRDGLEERNTYSCKQNPGVRRGHF